jgi:hypothetical protein
MVDTNPITGDRIISKMKDKKKYDDNYDRIFREKCKMEDDMVAEDEQRKLKKKEIEMDRNLTYNEICEELSKVEETVLLEILDIHSDELVDKFQDKIEENLERLQLEVEDLTEEYDADE